MIKLKIINSLIIGCFCVSAYSQQLDSKNIQSSATLNSTYLVSATDINFGTLTLTQTTNMLNVPGTLNLHCSNNISVEISLSNGNAPTITTGNTRYMVGRNGNPDRLHYGVYRPNGYGPGIYGPGQWSEFSTGPNEKIVVNTTGSPQSFTFMGKLNTYQNVLSDTYTDTLILTLIY